MYVCPTAVFLYICLYVCLTAYRLSTGDIASLDQSELITQLEMAVISGDILRSEITSLEKAKADNERDIHLWKSDVDSVEDRIKHAVCAQRVSCFVFPFIRLRQIYSFDYISAIGLYCNKI